MHVAGQCEAIFQICFGLVVLDLTGVDLRVEKREPPGDAVLFFFEQVQRHRSGMMRVQQASALVAELIAIGGQGVPFRFVLGMDVIELVDEHVAQSGDDVLGYLHPAVVILDLPFDSLDRHGLTNTAGAFGVPASADEVRVDNTFAVLRVCDHEAGAAVPTVDRAFQVVLMYLGLLSGDLMRGEYVLHSVPEFCNYQWLVKTVVAGAPEDDVALVVRVCEHLLDRGQPRCFRGSFRRWYAHQPAVYQLTMQHRGRVVSCRVRLECPPQQRGPVGVRDDCGNIAAEFVALVDVEVADGCASDGSTGGGFLGYAPDDLASEVAGVELRNRGHDAVQLIWPGFSFDRFVRHAVSAGSASVST